MRENKGKCSVGKEKTLNLIYRLVAHKNEGGNAGALSQPLGQNGIQAKLSSPQLIVSFSPSPFYLSSQLQNHPVNCLGKVFRLKTDVI